MTLGAAVAATRQVRRVVGLLLLTANEAANETANGCLAQEGEREKVDRPVLILWSNVS